MYGGAFGWLHAASGPAGGCARRRGLQNRIITTITVIGTLINITATTVATTITTTDRCRVPGNPAA
jgi:hypothetical protein